MSMKNFLKRFVAAFGDAAGEELDKSAATIPPHDLSSATSEEIDRFEVTPISHDYSTLPAGYDNWGLDEEP